MALEHDSDSALALAVRKAGSQTAFGKLIGKGQSVIHDWLRDEKPLPAEYVLTVEAELGISKHALRPDIYPLDDSPASSAHEAQDRAPETGTAVSGARPDALQGVRT